MSFTDSRLALLFILQGRNTHVTRTGLVVPLSFVEPQNVYSGGFAILFKILSLKNMPGDNVSCQNCFLLGVKKTFKHDLGTSYGFLISDEYM